MAEAYQFCTFKIGNYYFGFDVQVVQEVILRRELTPVPLAPPVVRGILNLRGQILQRDVRQVFLEEHDAFPEALRQIIPDRLGHFRGTSNEYEIRLVLVRPWHNISRGLPQQTLILRHDSLFKAVVLSPTRL